MSDQSIEIAEPPALSPLQTRVVVALAQGASITAAAASAGVGRSTVHKWLQCPAFQAAIKQAQQDYAEALNDEFKSLTGLALTRYRMLLESPKTPSTLVFRVAHSILSRRHDWRFYEPDDSEEVPESDSSAEDHQTDAAAVDEFIKSVSKCLDSSPDGDDDDNDDSD